MRRTTWIVSFSKAHEAAHEIGRFTDWDDVQIAARQAGAIGDLDEPGCFDVEGYEDNDDYAVWIERYERDPDDARDERMDREYDR